jgi:hypothetical protein
MAKSSEEKKTTKRRSKKSAEAVENAVVEAKDEVIEAKDEVIEAKDEVIEAKDEVIEAKDEVIEAKLDEDQPDVAENERIKRYDVMITSERAGYRPPKAAVAAMVQQLAFRGFASPVDEAIAEKWTEIYFEPGPAAHEIFLEKGYNSNEPVYHEMMMRFCEKPFYCDYAENPKRPLYWCIEIRGSRFQNPFGAFKKLFLDAFSLRISVADRPAQPLPEHLTVPKDEAPIERKKRERGHGLAGTEVEEM